MGYLVTVEGGEFTGKTSVVVPSLKQVLENAGFKVKVSREPGGTPKGEAIRSQIISIVNEYNERNEAPPSDLLAELFNEARKIHLEETVNPFFAKNTDGIVLLDRYGDSTMVYQGLEGGIPTERLLQMHKEYTGNRFPDLTFLLYFPESKFKRVFTKRKQYADSKEHENRNKMAWDESSVSQQIARQRNYLKLPGIYETFGISRRFVHVDASLHPFEVIKETVNGMDTFLKSEGKDVHLLHNYEVLKETGIWQPFDTIWREQKSISPEGVSNRKTAEK